MPKKIFVVLEQMFKGLAGVDKVNLPYERDPDISDSDEDYWKWALEWWAFASLNFTKDKLQVKNSINPDVGFNFIWNNLRQICIPYIFISQDFHTIYTRNNMGQKCEGNCGLWVLNKILKKTYPEILKKIVGAVWEIPAK